MQAKGSVTRLEKAPRGRCRKWKLRYRIDGKDRTRRFEGTYSQACEALARFRAELELPTAANETFAEYSREWLRRRAASGEYDERTLEGDAAVLRSLCRVFGPSKLRDMGRAAVIRGLEDVKARGATGRPLSGSTMAKVHATLKAVMREAVYDGALPSNPVDLVKAPKKDTPPKKAIPLDRCLEIGAVMRALPASAHTAGVALMLFEGLRIGEAVGLDWRHVGGESIRVEQQGARRGGVKGPKTANGVRTVPLLPFVAEVLGEWREAQRALLAARGLEQNGDTPVVTTAAGGRLRPKSLYAWWTRNSEPLFGVVCTPHELRHTFLTMLANSGAPMQSVKSIAGWSDIAMANVYVHSDEEADAEAVGLLDARMCRAAAGDVPGECGNVPLAHSNVRAAHRNASTGCETG